MSTSPISPDQHDKYDAYFFSETAQSPFQDVYTSVPKFTLRDVDLPVEGPDADGVIKIHLTGNDIPGELLRNLTLVTELPPIRHASESVFKHPTNWNPDTGGPNVRAITKSLPASLPRYSGSASSGGSGRRYGRSGSDSGDEYSSDSTFSRSESKSYEVDSDDETLTEDSSQSDIVPANFVHWAQSMGNLIFHDVSVKADKSPKVLTSHTDLWAEFRDEIHGHLNSPSDELVGRFGSESDLYKMSRRYQNVYTKPDLWFQDQPGKALVTKGLDNKLTLHLKMRDFVNLYKSSDSSAPYHMYKDMPVDIRDLKISARADIVHLGERDRNQFLHGPHTVYFQHVKEIKFPVNMSKSGKNGIDTHVDLKLPALGPVSQLHIGIQRHKHLKNKDFHRVSGRGGDDPLVNMKVFVRGEEWTPERESSWWRSRNSAAGQLAVPRMHIYTHSFGLAPHQRSQPIGFINTSDNEVVLRVLLQRGLGPATVHVFAVKPAVFRVDETRKAGIDW